MTMLIIKIVPSRVLANVSSLGGELLDLLPRVLVGVGADGIKHILILLPKKEGQKLYHIIIPG